MIKFKDLYVSLESDVPVQGDPASGPYCGWGWDVAWPEWWRIRKAGGGGCNATPSVSGAACQTVPMLLLVPGYGGADAAHLPLKDYLKTALPKAVQEPKAIDDLDELELLEAKLSGALQEVRARKAEIREDRNRSEAK